MLKKHGTAVFTTVVVPALQSSDSKEVKQQKLDSYIAVGLLQFGKSLTV